MVIYLTSRERLSWHVPAGCANTRWVSAQCRATVLPESTATASAYQSGESGKLGRAGGNLGAEALLTRQGHLALPPRHPPLICYTGQMRYHFDYFPRLRVPRCAPRLHAAAVRRRERRERLGRWLCRHGFHRWNHFRSDPDLWRANCRGVSLTYMARRCKRPLCGAVDTD